jgi:hypothetical protein
MAWEFPELSLYFKKFLNADYGSKENRLIKRSKFTFLLELFGASRSSLLLIYKRFSA